MGRTIQDLTKILLNKGIRPSYQRIKVLEYLSMHRTHPTVDEIFNYLIKEIPTLSKSTIYNTLNLFIKADLVNTVSIEGNETRYDIDISEHGHFKCESCGKIFDFDVDINNIGTKELQEFAISEKSIHFKGICPRCLKNK